MRSVTGEPALQVAVQTLAQLGQERLLVGRARAWAVLEGRPPVETELFGAFGEWLGEQRDHARACVAQCERMPGQLLIPRGNALA